MNDNKKLILVRFQVLTDKNKRAPLKRNSLQSTPIKEFKFVKKNWLIFLFYFYYYNALVQSSK
jgi:hypothetical protein